MRLLLLRTGTADREKFEYPAKDGCDGHETEVVFHEGSRLFALRCFFLFHCVLLSVLVVVVELPELVVSRDVLCVNSLHNMCSYCELDRADEV